MPVYGWATVAGPEVPRGPICMGIRPRRVRLSRSKSSNYLLPPFSSCSAAGTKHLLCARLCACTGDAKATGHSPASRSSGSGVEAVKRDNAMREVTKGCAGDLVVRRGFLEEMKYFWSLPSRVWS